MSKTVIYNGKIYVERGMFAEALLQEDGVITMTGSSEEVLAAAGDAEKIDCQGKTVLPGFNDSHLHLFYMGKAMLFPNLTEASCAEDLTEMCRAFLKENPDNRGFTAAGWNEETWKKGSQRKPNRRDMDLISRDIPIVLTRVCAHSCCVNSYVLDKLGIDRGHTEFEGAGIEVDEKGEPTGILTEKALHAALNLIPPLGRQELKRALVMAMEYAVARGVTTVQSNDIGLVVRDQEECSALIKEVYDEGRALLRYTAQQFYYDTKSLESYCSGPFFNESYADDWYRRGPLKILKDGSLGSRTAMLREDYSDAPGVKGVEVNSDAFMEELIRCAHQNGMQVAVHAIGDEAIEKVVNLYEQIGAKKDENPLRHSIIHCQITDMPLLQRIKSANILTCFQPIFLQSDLHIAERRCGKERMKTSYAFKTAEEMGVHASYGTDAPVEDLNPFPCIYCAVTRKDLNGYPPEGFYPKECVDVETAVDAYTIESAYHEFREQVKGRLKPGYYADLIILNQDIFSCPPEDICHIRPTLTMVGGKVVYTA